VPAAVTVWTVELEGASSPQEVRGLLSLTSDALVFAPRDERLSERRYPLREVSHARRLFGSPVLLIVRETAEGPRRTAFYFVQPPPLHRPDAVPTRPVFGPFARNSRRRTRRQNVTYLGMWNRERKALLREWQRQVRTAAAAARA
jgi:hypothetical protein